MSFKNILGQEHVIQNLQKVLKKGCLPHSYIFLGMQGVGKTFTAKELAKSLNCKESDTDSCGKCVNCKRISIGTSPDVHWISLESDKKFIGINDIKELQYASSLKPVESNYKIFIIQNADRLSEEASNCLLKTLEEPPLSTLIILITNSLDFLLETIVSRCQIIKFLNLPKDTIKTFLRTNYSIDEGALEWYTHVSNGSIGEAVKLMNANLFNKNETLINDLFNLKVRDNFKISKEIQDGIANEEKSFEEKRSYLKTILNLILNYYRDLLLYKTGVVEKSYYFNSKHEDLIKAQSNLISIETIIKIIDHIFVAFDNLESNANTNLLLENLLTRLAVTSRR